MESDRKPMHNSEPTEPILEVVEGDALKGEIEPAAESEPQAVTESLAGAEPNAETAIVPNAFETVLAQYDEHQAPKYVEPEAPAYKNRALIAAVCIVGGIFAGRLTMQPKVETVYKDRERPILVANQTAPKAETPKVDNAFRELADLKDFDPWQPLNGGFPLPPKSTQANIVSRSGGSSQAFVPAPPHLSGAITPLDPNDMGAPLPNVGGPGIAFPKNPEPGGKTPTTKPGQDGHVAVVAKDDSSGKEKYVAMTVTGAEPASGAKSLAGVASSLGGSAQTFTHMAEDGTVESQGVLLIIPASKFDAAKSKIDGLGGASVDSSIDGNASSEQGRINNVLSARLAKLRDKKKDLLVDFLEDAQPVKQISEAIDFEARALSATRLPSQSALVGKVVIRVMLK